MKHLLTSTLCSLLLGAPAMAEFFWEDHYLIEDITLPADIDPQIGGLDMNEDGDIVACFHRGQVMTYDTSADKWSLFAEGLHEPLGIYAEKGGTVVVVQRPEITRLHDTDGDGKADFYETVCDDWGVSGNYHEFTFGLEKDSKGNFYIALGTASNGSGVRDEIRGEWNDAGGLTHDRFKYNNAIEEQSWASKKKGTPRMYARVPYRGCVLKVSPGNRTAEVYATGVRTPNGLYVDEHDQLWVSDNQGDWVGASKVHRIVEGGFHGHAASLLWDPKNPVTDAVPASIPPAELNKRRTKAPFLLPQGDCGNSITQMTALQPEFSNGTAGNNLIVGEMNHSHLSACLPDTVKGEVQGAVYHHLKTSTIGAGNNRLLYSPDNKSLYIGKTHLSWPGREGIKKVTYKGKPFLVADRVQLTETGFDITFNAPITDIGAISDYLIESYVIAYYAGYGSPKNELRSDGITKVEAKGNVLSITLDKLEAGRVYDIRLPSSITSDLSDIAATRYWYTAHQILD